MHVYLMFCLQKGNLLYSVEQILTLSAVIEHYAIDLANAIVNTCGQSHEKFGTNSWGGIDF